MNQKESLTETDGRWAVWKIALVLYPLGLGAAAINIYFVGLMIQAIGFNAFSPEVSIYSGIIIGIPFTYLFARHIRKLIDEASK